jgi:uncharacterized membrane protein YdjX (TVP38/TMEM64 family)
VIWLKKYWQWITLLLGLIGLSVAVSFLPVDDWVKSFTHWVRNLGPAGALIFIGVYAVAALLFFPGAILTIAAGFVYGIVGGTAVALVGATLGAGLAFLAGRYLFRRRIRKFADANKKFGAIDDAIGEQGWKIVGLLRLSPLIPFNVSNYFYGITAIGFWPYLLASFFGMLPGTLLYAYLGVIGQAGFSGGEKGHSPLEWTFLALGLLATIAVTVFVTQIAKKALKKSGATRRQ